MTFQRLVQLAAAKLCRAVSALPICASSRFSSGTQEPQLVPALSCVPISLTERAPEATASQIAFRPTPKQAQTTGPVPATPFIGLPDSSIFRSWLLSSRAANNLVAASQSPASLAGPRKRQLSI